MIPHIKNVLLGLRYITPEQNKKDARMDLIIYLKNLVKTRLASDELKKESIVDLISNYVDIYLNCSLTDNLLQILNMNFVELLNSEYIIKDSAVILQLCNHLISFISSNQNDISKFKTVLYLIQILAASHSCSETNLLEIINHHIQIIEFINKIISENIQNINIKEQLKEFIE